MIRLSSFVLIVVGLSCSASGIDQTKINDYLYGPYLNDPVIQPFEYTNSMRSPLKKQCNEKRINSLYDSFFSPGTVSMNNEKSIQTVIDCALKKNRKAAELMEKWVYSDQLKQTATTKNRAVRDIIYNPTFISKIAKVNPKILSVIPDSHPLYLDIASEILADYPRAFNHITLRYKRHPKLTQQLFYAMPSYDDIYKHMAIQYSTSESQRKEFVMHNGLLYIELPIEHRNDPFLAYHAYIQNDMVTPYIPKSIVDVFNSSGTIMVPRYMTKVTMVRQKIGRALAAWVAPLKESFSNKLPSDTVDMNGSELLNDVEISINELNQIGNPDIVTSTNVFEDSTETPGSIGVYSTYEKVDVKIERTVVTDIRIINKIEIKKQRRLLNLWRIARFQDNGQVYIAMFRPDGKNNLGAIVVKQNDRFMFSDYAAVFSMDGESIWRLDDEGTFSARTFMLDHVLKSPEGNLIFSFSWKGKYTTNQFNLVDQSGFLIKEFVNYYFE
jgi:hypothetical protein